jgi:hypothetical protein
MDRAKYNAAAARITVQSASMERMALSPVISGLVFCVPNHDAVSTTVYHAAVKRACPYG